MADKADAEHCLSAEGGPRPEGPRWRQSASSAAGMRSCRWEGDVAGELSWSFWREGDFAESWDGAAAMKATSSEGFDLDSGEKATSPESCRFWYCLRPSDGLISFSWGRSLEGGGVELSSSLLQPPYIYESPRHKPFAELASLCYSGYILVHARTWYWGYLGACLNLVLRICWWLVILHRCKFFFHIWGFLVFVPIRSSWWSWVYYDSWPLCDAGEISWGFFHVVEGVNRKICLPLFKKTNQEKSLIWNKWKNSSRTILFTVLPTFKRTRRFCFGQELV
jgi:hypothetical protein